MPDRVISLKPKLDRGWVRCVVVQEPVLLPAICEVNVAGCTVFKDLCSNWETWTSKPVPRLESCVWLAYCYCSDMSGCLGASHEFGELFGCLRGRDCSG